MFDSFHLVLVGAAFPGSRCVGRKLNINGIQSCGVMCVVSKSAFLRRRTAPRPNPVVVVTEKAAQGAFRSGDSGPMMLVAERCSVGGPANPFLTADGPPS
ncbi:hypothetical protein Q1695_013419 [Nippostrongylus brasiliensis]|nr:hypothetical protein Q1695_013419 [Nippostrongylus brasiliensis]